MNFVILYKQSEDFEFNMIYFLSIIYARADTITIYEDACKDDELNFIISFWLNNSL